MFSVSNTTFFCYCIVVFIIMMSSFVKKVVIANLKLPKISKDNIIVVPKEKDQFNSRIIQIVYKKYGINYFGTDYHFSHYKIFSDTVNFETDIYQGMLNLLTEQNNNNNFLDLEIIYLIAFILIVCITLLADYLFATNWITCTVMGIFMCDLVIDYSRIREIKITLFETGELSISNGSDRFETQFDEKSIDLAIKYKKLIDENRKPIDENRKPIDKSRKSIDENEKPIDENEKINKKIIDLIYEKLIKIENQLI